MDISELLNSLNFSSIAWQISSPIIFSIADVITGFIQAVINKNVDSTKMRNGLLHKALLITIILLSFVADFTFSLNFISKIVCGYVIIMEVISIAENITSAGVDVKLLSELLKVKKGDERK